MKWVQVYKQFVMLVVEQNKHRNAYACCYIFICTFIIFFKRNVHLFEYCINVFCYPFVKKRTGKAIGPSPVYYLFLIYVCVC